jgi:hypothetical protein
MAGWQAANDQRGLAFRLQEHYNEGLRANLTATRGGGLVELEQTLRRHNRLPADSPEREMLARGITDQLLAKMQTQGELHNVGKIFANRRAREILSQIIGEDNANTFSGFVQRAGMATHTFNRNKNSITPSVLDSNESHGWLSNIAMALWHHNPVRAVGHTIEALNRQRTEQVRNQMAGMMAHNTGDLTRLNQTLQRIEEAGRPIHDWIRNLGQSGRGAGAAAGMYSAGRQYY